jgi:tetratricopeptide (TPR) repeat protein
MSGSTGNPSPDRVERTGQLRLHRAEHLRWSELADAVWLTTATQSAWSRHIPDHRPEPVEEPEPASDPPKPERFPEARPPPQHRDPPRVADSRASPPEPEADSAEMRDETPKPPATTLPSGVTGHPPEPRAQPTALAVSALPGESAIVRALRPLKRRVRSWYGHAAVLDEDATAERAVQDGLWWPVTRPATRRWLDLTLVVDTSPSLLLWHPRLSRFIALLKQTGAFHTIQLRHLDTCRSADGEPVVPALRGGTSGAPHRDPAELLDPTGRRVMLVLTDMVADAWRRDLVAPVLARWARGMPVAVIHAHPQRLWHRSGPKLHRAQLTVPNALSPNRRWHLELPDAWLDDESPGEGAVPVPILELDARYLAWWARLVTATHTRPANALVMFARDHPREAPSQAIADIHTLSADDRVRAFLSTASPPAFRLATLLAAAAVPITVPVAKAVQSQMVPDSGPDHLAEVLTSPLLREHTATDTDTLSFPPAVRQTLLSSARRSETVEVTRVLADQLADQQVLDYLHRALLDRTDATGPDLTADETVHAQAEKSVLFQALSGPYLARMGGNRPSIEGSGSTHNAGSPTSSSSAVVDSPQQDDLMSDHMPDAAQSDTSVQTDGSAASHDSTRQRTNDTADHLTQGQSGADARLSATQQGSSPTFAPPNSGMRQGDDAPPVWGDVPPRNPNFTGRQELLERLSSRLSPGSTTAVLPAALHGMGGIGKTQMAVEYIYRHLNDYDAIWWIQATHQAQIRAGLTKLAQQLGLPGSAESHTAVTAVREALRRGEPYRRWLLVFDSAESPDEVRRFFPTNGPGEILITSRNSDWAGIARPLEINVFERKESKELLRLRGPEIDDHEADQLAEKLGDLPLAIEQAAAWLAVTGMPVAEYLRLFDEKVTEILDASISVDYEASVAAAWNVSFDELGTRNPAAHQLLQVCAFFAPEPIPRSLFTGLRQVTISPELDAMLRDPIRLSRAIRDIGKYSLAKIDHRSNTLLLHRLVQLVLRDRMAPPQRQQMRHGAHVLLANMDPNDPATVTHWSQYRDLLPHAYSAEVVDCGDSWVRQLVLNLMSYLFSSGDHDEAAKLAGQALEHWSEKLGPTDPQTLEAAANLGRYLWSQGQYSEAAELNQKTLELRLQISGENTEETLAAQSNVLADLKAQGDFAAARKLSEDIYLRSKKLFGEDDPETLDAAYNHALNLRVSGDYAASSKLNEDTYHRKGEVLGLDHPKTIGNFGALILDRREAGNYPWARAEQEKMYEQIRKQRGDDSFHAWLHSHFLGICRRKDGDHTGAIELSGPAFDYMSRRYGDNHPRTMEAALAYSIDLRHAGDLPAARQLGEQTFERYRIALGEHHPHTLSAAIDLAVTLRLLGNAADARQLDERSLEQFRMALGPDHPYAIVSAVCLASDLAALGETDAALTLGEDALGRANRALGRDHPTTLAAALNYVLDLRVLGRDQEAETQFTDVVDRYRHVLGESHPATLAASRGVRADCDIDPLPL